MNNKGYKVISKQPRYQGRFTPQGNEAMKTVGIRFSLPVVEWLESEAKKKGLSKSDIVREIVQRSIEA